MPQPANPSIANYQFRTLVNADVGNYNGLGVIGTGTHWNQVMGTTNFNTPTVAGADRCSSTAQSGEGLW